jgi:hypothetical protein
VISSRERFARQGVQTQPRRQLRAEQRSRRRPSHRLARVCPDLVELVRGAHVVEVGVAEHQDRVVLEQLRPGPPQVGDAEPAVQYEVTVPPAQVPEVGPQQRVHVRLGEQGDRGVDRRAGEPGGGDRERCAHRAGCRRVTVA